MIAALRELEHGRGGWFQHVRRVHVRGKLDVLRHETEMEEMEMMIIMKFLLHLLQQYYLEP